ncbi:MAG: hypothetical protein ABIH89_07590 [Elusimicrobiota bacterium]
MARKFLVPASLSAVSIAFFYLLSRPPDAVINRMSWIKAGIMMFLHRPVTGFGPGSVPHILPAFTQGDSFSLYIHSFPVAFAAEYGIVVLIAFLWIIIFLHRRQDTNKSRETKAAYLSLSLILIYNLFEYNLTIPLIAMLVSLIAGTFTGQKKTSLRMRKRFYNFLLRTTMAIAAVLFITGITMRPFISSRNFTKGIYYLRSYQPLNADIFFNKSLKVLPFSLLPRIGFALNDIYTEDLYGASSNIYSSLPVIDNNPSYTFLQQGRILLDKGDRDSARNKFWQAIKLRLFQYGLDPAEYMVPFKQQAAIFNTDQNTE